MKSKMYLDHQSLISRIKDIFADEEQSVVHDALQRIFPEIYEEYKASAWNRIHKIGHIYARLNNDKDYVSSLLMPVVIPASIGNDYIQIAVLNLIAGNFWKDTVICQNGLSHNYDISDEDWSVLFKNYSDEVLIHIGSFDHGASDIFMRGKHHTNRLYQIKNT